MKKKGFTLIEILVTVTIIAVLLATAAASYSSINKRSRDARRRSDVEQLRSSLEMYRTENGWYPDAGSGSYIKVTDPTFVEALASYINAIPQDPANNASLSAPASLGNDYWYKAMSVSGTHYYGYCLVSYMEQSANAVTTCKGSYQLVPETTPSSTRIKISYTGNP